MRFFKKPIFIFSFLGCLLAGLIFFYGPTIVQAQADLGLNFAAQTGLGNEDPRLVTARIIRTIIGFLGIIALVLVIYAGWLWMSSAGNEEKIDKAKKLLRNAVIGLVIILAAWGIASFIITKLFEITGGGGGGGTCGGSCSPGEYCCSGVCQSSPCTIGGGATPFQVRNNIPADGATNLPRNTVIRYRFTENVRANSVDDTSFIVFEEPAHTPVLGTRTVNGSYIEFIPDAMCPPPNDTLHCFTANTDISVEAVDTKIYSNSGKQLDCRAGNPCIISMAMGNYVDTAPPRINLASTQVCAAPNNTMEASATDDYGISKIDFYIEGNFIGSEANTPPPLTPFNATMFWDGSSFTVGQMVGLKAVATDFDSNEASAEKQVKISPSTCCNGQQDCDLNGICETGIDCGGSCLACNGGACAPDRNQPGVCSDQMCSSDFCTANGSSAASCEAAGFPVGTTNCCLCQSKPKITSITPLGGFCSHDSNIACQRSTELADCGSGNTCNLVTPNGNSGNFITISGEGFGTTRGQVFFTGPGGTGRELAKLADDPIVGNALCGTNVWTNNQIIAVVPTTASDGPLTVKSIGGGSDSTNDSFGALINDFKKNTIDRPGLCTISPTSGRLNDTIDYKGIKLIGGEAYFGSLSQYVKAISSNFTRDKEGTAEVPNLQTGRTTTYLTRGNVYSNFLAFTKNSEPTNGPVISSIEPTSGPIGQYITIRGSGFGNSRDNSSVHFRDISGPEADYKFPEICANSIWTDRQIIIKVPAGIALGQYSLLVSRTGFPAADSGLQKFEVTAGTPDPGVCRLDPVLGQTNSAVMLWGEYFRAQDSNSVVKFYNNKVQTGAAITFWDIDNSVAGAIKPWKVVTTVPTGAITGPVNIEVGSPIQISNSFNFTVGVCQQDADCGPTATCCAAGLPEAGRCKANASDCYGSVATSVFEWQFSTGYTNLACQPDQTQCGTVCCAGGCDVTDPTKCALCAAGQNRCGDGSCCSGACAPGIGGGPSYCPASCSGYVYNQCIEGYFCPNSPGQCSPSVGAGGQVVTGNCDNGVCSGLAGCAQVGSCEYNSTTNRCILSSTLTNGCSARDLTDGNGDPIMNGNQVAEGRCELFRGNPVWTINWSTSCPAGWARGVGNTCIDNNSINGSCSVCANGASCVANGPRGVCAVGGAVCSSGSSCDPIDQKCKKTDNGTCECCCSIDNPERDCCAGLSCDGSCGAGPRLGYCSGCVVGGVAQDDLCNCTGHDGKVCDASVDPRGRCVDCSAITDPAECSAHARCCVDGRTGDNKCTSLTAGQPIVPEVVGGATLNFCGFHNCTGVYPNSCNPLAVKNGVYRTTDACDQACVDAPIPCGTQNNCSIGPSCPTGMTCNLTSGGDSCVCKRDGGNGGDPCTDPNSLACLLTGGCTAGYTCLDRPGDTCRCCCKPSVGGSPDSCKQIDSSLTCLADQGSCTGADRGLCCGCSKDSICGDVQTVGCSTVGSRCCSSRPVVDSHVPAIDAREVCRNTVIEATFNQKMDLSSFNENSNVLVIGDFGTSACPTGYSIIASAPPVNGLARIGQFFKKVAVTIVPFLASRPAFADMSNFCSVAGSVVGSDVTSTKSKVSFRLQQPLAPQIKYYVVLKGDPALATIGNNRDQDHYNTHITNSLDIGMIGIARGRSIPTIFNHTEFKNAEVWSFTTSREICALSGVQTVPNFYLFQRTGQEIYIDAYARTQNGQIIQGLPRVYDWSWNWQSANDSLVTVVQQSIPNVALATAGNTKDAQTLGKATATITSDTVNQVSTRGQTTSGVSQLRLFLCENPWPVYFAIPGYPWPWRDDVTGVEFYYCRDKAGVGTSDDLPALTESPLVGPTSRRICMFGNNSQQVCRSDSDCGVSGSCLPEVLKEFFFFREQVAGIPTLQGTVDPVGKAVTLQWDTTTLGVKYKVYYGLYSQQYTSSVEVVPPRLGTITKTISGLANGRDYYFAVTALTDKNQESGFSNEVRLRPTDTTPPASPSILASGGDQQISIFWNPVGEAINYMAYIGAQSRGSDPNYVYPVSKIVRSNPLPNTPNVVFSGLDNSGTYYVAVKSIDAYGNLSPYSNEIMVRSNTPYLIGASSNIRNGASLQWLPFSGAQGYTIKYTSASNPDPITIDVNNSVFAYTLNNLNVGETYTFSIFAKKANNTLSNESNARAVTITSTVGS